MENLPTARVNFSPPFFHTGVDNAGPVNLILFVGHGQKTSKHYVALFVCFATRAIHLECVEDYSSDKVMTAFVRFVSRRGLLSDVYSDNGTNFQGADRELQRSFRALINDPIVQSRIANDGIKWHFLPPAASHFGGLWEAGVESLKDLRRVIISHTLS